MALLNCGILPSLIMINEPRMDFIFKSTINDNHISYDSMRYVIKELAQTAGLADQTRILGWHSCRKTRADHE